MGSNPLPVKHVMAKRARTATLAGIFAPASAATREIRSFPWKTKAFLINVSSLETTLEPGCTKVGGNELFTLGFRLKLIFIDSTD